jgi:hypothetical protein
VDRSQRPADSDSAAREVLQQVDGWTIVVESWDAGEDELIVEVRGLGYESREVRPTTAVDVLSAAGSELLPWSELPGVGPEVSGVAEYRAEFTLDAVAAPGERLLLDLGSTAGGLGSVVVNGGDAVGFDTSRPVVDITAAAREGVNTIVVRVASSLNNRLIARGYYDDIPDMGLFLLGRQEAHVTVVRPHGLLGPVRVVREA